jgi:hypothetical protein
MSTSGVLLKLKTTILKLIKTLTSALEALNTMQNLTLAPKLRTFALLFVFILFSEHFAVAHSAHSDSKEAIALLDIGELTLRGRPRVPEKNIPNLEKKENHTNDYLYSSEEPVYLFPYTAKLKVLIEKFSHSPTYIDSLLGSSNNFASQYNAVTFTDNEGYFTFRGLKPGFYVLLTAIPYEVSASFREKTGNTQTTISGGWGGAFSAVTEPIYRYTNERRQKEQRIFKIVEVLSKQKVTDLGEIE